MDQQSIFFTVLVAIVSFPLMLLAIKFQSKKINIKVEEKISTSFTIWFSSFFISFTLFLKIALQEIENTIEIIIYSRTISNTFFEVMQKISINIGFTFLATFFVYYIINTVTKLFLGDRKNHIEMDNNNITYFVIKGLVFVLFTFAILPFFEHFLQWFAPIVNTPFYH
ncbi:hypothetical protein FFWV33_12290 [Flavobacterium faecale]|uniref:Uncharacterized protein n=1 Tax=Flavobacterium faecale TaxID=1355330 RepID=A0A2S1LEN4_9FLAO|nr:hypothetical protein [Flavobacterium faecale]AWG22240.1 hypothetical protein FFWV33_12290 [Flavobacterium faecale]